MQEDLSVAQQPDLRPGHYYVSALPGIGEVQDGRYWLLAGPWTTHAEALAQVRPVWDYCLRVDPVGAAWKSFGTCRCKVVEGEAAPVSKLGSDAAAWAPREPLKVGDAVWLVADEKLEGIGAATGPGDRFCGNVTKLSKLRICVRFGHSGFGQREYVFTNKGEVAPFTGGNVLGKCHLDLAS